MIIFIVSSNKDHREGMWFHHDGQLNYQQVRGNGDGSFMSGNGGEPWYVDEQMDDSGLDDCFSGYFL